MVTTTYQKTALGFLAILLTVGFYTTTAEAKHTESTTSKTSSSTSKTRIKSEAGISSSTNAACVAGAVTKREGALTEAWSDLAESITAALTKRSEALTAAWSTTAGSDRAADSKRAWATWKEEKAKAQKTFKDTRKEVWTSFKSTIKNECKTTVPKEEALERSTPDSLAI